MAVVCENLVRCGHSHPRRGADPAGEGGETGGWPPVHVQSVNITVQLRRNNLREALKTSSKIAFYSQIGREEGV